jgi:hypothetical protein
MLDPPQPQEGSRSKKTCHDTIRDTAVLPSKAIEIRSIPTSQSAPSAMEVAPMTVQPSAPDSRQRVSILQLPAETLLQIASLLCGSNAIINLSRVNKRMHSVTEEAMAKELVVHESRLTMAIEWLAFHPDLITHVSTVDLGALRATSDYAPRDHGFSAAVSHVLRNSIWIDSPNTIGLASLSSYKHPDSSIWSYRHQYCLDVLFSFCPNIKTLSIRLPDAKIFDRNLVSIFPIPHSSALPMANPDSEPVTPLQGVGLQLMRKALRTLVIASDIKWAGPFQYEILRDRSQIEWRRTGKQIITLQGFNKLEHLDIPMITLGLPESIQFRNANGSQQQEVPARINFHDGRVMTTKMIDLPAKVLPLSLISMRLRLCNDWTFAFLRKVVRELCRIPVQDSNLRRIDLYFNTCARSHILLCVKASSGPSAFLETLAMLTRMGIKVVFYGGNEKPVDMRQELTILNSLRSEEVSLVALARRQFSDLDMQAISRRRSSRLAKRIFMRHTLTYFALFNSSTFDAKYWAGSAFFHGIENTKYDPSLGCKQHNLPGAPQPVKTVGSWRRNRVVFDMDNFIFAFRRKSKSASGTSAMKQISFQGKTFAMFTQLFHASKRVIKTLTVPRCKKNKSDAKTSKAKTSGVRQCHSKTSKRISKDRTAAHQPIYFQSTTEPDIPCSSVFNSVSRLKEDWKFYLQPHVVAK